MHFSHVEKPLSIGKIFQNGRSFVQVIQQLVFSSTFDAKAPCYKVSHRSGWEKGKEEEENGG